MSIRLIDIGYNNHILDGDAVRRTICLDLGFSLKDRTENVRRISHIARKFNQSGIYTIVALISPLDIHRKYAAEIIGAASFNLIYLNTPLEICEQRDPKGLYAKVRKKEINQFTGISSPYEPPSEYLVKIDTSRISVESCVEIILEKLLIESYQTQPSTL